jgi:hypothetical protein
MGRDTGVVAVGCLTFAHEEFSRGVSDVDGECDIEKDHVRVFDARKEIFSY